MPMESSHVFTVALYCLGVITLLQSLDWICRLADQGYTCQHGHSTPVYSNFWMTWIEYISKEVRYPSHEKVECDFLFFFSVFKMQTGHRLSPQVILI